MGPILTGILLYIGVFVLFTGILFALVWHEVPMFPTDEERKALDEARRRVWDAFFLPILNAMLWIRGRLGRRSDD